MKSLSDTVSKHNDYSVCGSTQGANYTAVSEVAWNFSSTAPH